MQVTTVGCIRGRRLPVQSTACDKQHLRRKCLYSARGYELLNSTREHQLQAAQFSRSHKPQQLLGPLFQSFAQTYWCGHLLQAAFRLQVTAEIEKHRSMSADSTAKSVRVRFLDACEAGDVNALRQLLGDGGTAATKEVVEALSEKADSDGVSSWFDASQERKPKQALEKKPYWDISIQPRSGKWVDCGLLIVCALGRVEALRTLLALTGPLEVDVHVESSQFGTEGAFHIACANGRVEIVRMLLSLTGSRRVDVYLGSKKYPVGALRSACTWGNLDVVRELLALKGDRTMDVHAGSCGTAPCEAPLCSACANGHVHVVRELLSLTGERRVDVNGPTKYGFGDPLWWACVGGNVGVVRELLSLTGDREVDVHAHSESNFRFACKNGHRGVVCELLKLTGDRSVRPAFEACREGYGAYLLKHALWYGSETVCSRRLMLLLRASVRH